jgi:subtilisin family serine protease
MLHPDLALCLQDFFAQLSEGLSPPGGAAGPDVAGQTPLFAGEYVANAAPQASESLGNVVLTPDFVLQVAGANVTAAGTGAERSFTVPSALGASPRKQTLVLLRERADIAADDRETMARVMADLPEGAQWAEKLAGLPNRSALALPLGQIAQVPAGLPSSELDDLRRILGYFFTYKADGAYYAKYSTPPPAGQFPTHLGDDYRRENFLETKLQQGRLYVYAVLPESVWRGPAAQAGMFRELVFRLDDQGPGDSPRFRMSLLHTAALYLDPATPATPALPKEQVVVFFATAGVGLAVGASGQEALSPLTAGTLVQVGDGGAPLQRAIADHRQSVVGSEQNPMLLIVAHVAADFPRTPLPAGVEHSGAGRVRTLRCPLQSVVAVAERPDVNELEIGTYRRPLMQDAATALNLVPTFYANLGNPQPSAGTGVLIGIIDSGVDGSHIAFQRSVAGVTQSRLVAVWDQNVAANASSPLNRRPGAAAAVLTAYAGMTYGQEFERSAGHNMLQNFDPPQFLPGGGEAHGSRHGTHVAGIAGGRASPAPLTWPGGIAQNADYVVVCTNFSDAGLLDGIRYCFQKATELGLPCVVNMSLGGHWGAHDGTDPFSRGVTALVSDPALGDGQFAPGRIVCAAAGNERGDAIHWMKTLHSLGDSDRMHVRMSAGWIGASITLWAYADDGGDVRLELTGRTANRFQGSFVRTTAVLPQASHAPAPLAPLVSPAGTPAGSNWMVQFLVTNGPPRPGNGHRNPTIQLLNLTPGNPTAVPPIADNSPTEWVITVKNRSRRKVYLDAWIVGEGELTGSGVHDSRKVGGPADAVGAISVASLVSRATGSATVGQLSTFSSPGPLRAVRGRQAIDVTAPGQTITSAQSASVNGTMNMSGTSMACPVVTGIVACMLQRDPTLNLGHVREKLRAAVTAPTNAPNDWGAGKLDASLITF